MRYFTFLFFIFDLEFIQSVQKKCTISIMNVIFISAVARMTWTKNQPAMILRRELII